MGVAVGLGDRARARDRGELAVVDQEVVGARQGGEVARRLLVALLRERRPAVDREAREPEQGDDRQREDDQDLAIGAGLAGRVTHAAFRRHSSFALAELVSTISPRKVASGVTGVNADLTVTLIQSPAAQARVTAAPVMSMQA